MPFVPDNPTPRGRFVPDAPAQPEATTAERALGSVPGRFALGAANTLVGGPLQLGANIGSFLNRNVAAPVYDFLGMDKSAEYARNPQYDFGQMTNQAQQNVEAAKRRGMEANGTEGADIAGVLGSAATGVAALRNLPVAASLTGRIGQGAKIGAGMGLVAPVTEGDYEDTKGAQVAIGGALGAAVPAVIGTGRAIYDKGNDVAAVLTRSPEGLSRLTGKYFRERIGEQNVQPVVDALRRHRPDVAYQQPTASQALRNVPEGSPIAAQTRITATQPGGASAAFGRRWQDQEAAIEGAKQTRAAVAGELRNRALSAATKIDKNFLQSELARIAQKDGIRANESVQSALRTVINQLENSKTPKEIYGVRKTITDMLNKKHGSERNVDLQALGPLRKMRAAIDDAIESGGGGPDWREYLRVYAKRSDHIRDAIESVKKPFASPQRTNMQGGQRIAQEEIPALPNPLIREVMVFNRLASMVKNQAEPAIDDVMARQLLNPKELARAIESADPKNRALLEALLRYSRAAPVPAVQE